MGCQYEIADKIADKIVREKKGDYLFSLKGNQGCLYEDVEEYFAGLDFLQTKVRKPTPNSKDGMV
jgi:predicted transposase YbfD/YdcC